MLFFIKLLFYMSENIFHTNRLEMSSDFQTKSMNNPFQTTTHGVSSCVLSRASWSWLEGLTCIPGIMVTAALWTDMAKNAVAFLFICYFWIFSPDFLKLYVHATMSDCCGRVGPLSVLEEQSDRKQPFNSNTDQICSNIKKSEVIERMILIVCCIVSFSFPGRSCGILRTHLNSWSNFPFLYLHKYEFIFAYLLGLEVTTDLCF